MAQPKIDRRGWLSWFLQKRRRARCLLPAPVLTAAYPDLAVWTWDYPNPAYWYAYHQHAVGDPFTYDDRGAGTDRQYAPDGGQYPMFIVGCDADGNEITGRSNAVRPEDALPTAPVLVSLGTVAGDTTWRAVATIAVDDWQFCTTDNAFDPQVKSFDQWVYEADAPDTDFVNINSMTATVTVDFAYCAARYRVGATWSSWTGVFDATVIPPPVELVLSSDGHGHLTWTCNFVVDTAFIIQRSDDGVNWSNYDAQDCDKFYRDSSGQAGYFRIAIGDEDGNAVPPYSNVVHSDGL